MPKTRLCFREGPTRFDIVESPDGKAKKGESALDFLLSFSGKSLAYEMLVQRRGNQRMSELVEISKLNGSFRRNYGKFLGAYLYLRSIRAARRSRSTMRVGVISIACSTALAWMMRHGLAWLRAY